MVGKCVLNKSIFVCFSNPPYLWYFAFIVCQFPLSIIFLSPLCSFLYFSASFLHFTFFSCHSHHLFSYFSCWCFLCSRIPSSLSIFPIDSATLGISQGISQGYFVFQNILSLLLLKSIAKLPFMPLGAGLDPKYLLNARWRDIESPEMVCLHQTFQDQMGGSNLK